MARDNFSKKTIKILQLRVGHRCSNPDCLAGTSAPHSCADKSVCAGEASHIYAAAPGGPRFQITMSPTERASIENAIWLCKICARKIDLDPERFTSHLLHTWKREAEKAAELNLGKPTPSCQAIETLTQALTGHPIKYIESAIPNVVTASKRAIEKENPFINVDINYIDGVQSFFISPKKGQPPLEFHFSPPPNVSRDIDRSIEEGIPFSTPDFIEVKSNQPIFDGKMVKISMDPSITHQAIVKIFKDSQPHPSVSIPGTIRAGTKFFTFEGGLGLGFWNIIIRQPLLHKNISGKTTVNFRTGDFKQWKGRPLLFLPDFPTLKLLNDILGEGSICIELYIDGHQIMGGTSGDSFQILSKRFIEALETIIFFDRELRLNCTFDEDEFYKLDHSNLQFIKRMWIDGPVEEVPDSLMTFSIPMDSRHIPAVTSKDKGSDMLLEKQPEEMDFFGKKIRIPSQRIYAESTTCDISSISDDGHTVTAQFKQIVGSKISYSLDGSPVVCE